jgi:hypothetical protein
MVLSTVAVASSFRSPASPFHFSARYFRFFFFVVIRLRRQLLIFVVLCWTLLSNPQKFRLLFAPLTRKSSRVCFAPGL